MTGARLAGFWIILLKLHDYCCNIFVSLMRLGSMSRVAKETGYETSFVSRRIAALEKSVASKLFERTTRLCMPTHEAHALLDRILPYVVDLERRLEMASRAVKATSGDVVLKVRCASGLLPFVVRAIKPFRDNHPEYKFEAHPARRQRHGRRPRHLSEFGYVPSLHIRGPRRRAELALRHALLPRAPFREDRRRSGQGSASGLLSLGCALPHRPRR